MDSAPCPIDASCVSPPTPFDLGFFVLLALFVPWLCVMAAKMADIRRSRRVDLAGNDPALSKTEYYKILIKKDGSPGIDGLYIEPPLSVLFQAAIPTLVIAALNIFFADLIALTRQCAVAGDAIMLLLGDSFSKIGQSPSDLAQGLLRSLDIMSFAYLGWFVWTVYTVFSRVVMQEIVLATYYNILSRLVIAVFVALVAGFFPPALVTTHVTSADVIGFGAGLFPDSVLTSMFIRFRKQFLETDLSVPDPPLQLLQGISGFRQMRLYEMGFDGCMNLAKANVVEMYFKSHLKLSEVVDWVGQAQLAVLVGKENFVALQKRGYRTILDLKRAAGTVSLLGFIAKAIDYTPEQLQDVAKGLDDDPSFTLLKDIASRLNELV